MESKYDSKDLSSSENVKPELKSLRAHLLVMWRDSKELTSGPPSAKAIWLEERRAAEYSQSQVAFNSAINK